ncbi:surface-adhesin E family protein [Myxacorys almedinensis]|uniref:Surface-adhesin protein E-like domain-containing protein n=1 Tax=Myxacorys almedinensis A TaxID=2690445 RepID=A0A8J8CL47_9CYAN|nr:surface-adhesin E family protein [Myxacorys almedinensis]NDJ15692.1 hypothetical protein [Myxacorys almedinensis A]
MNCFLKCLVVGAMFAAYSPAVGAVEWTKITENSVNDKFFVDVSSIQRNDAIVWYWEYREFPEPNNALLETEVDQPLYGAVMRWSVDCTSKAQRLRKVNAYTKNRQLIQKFDYGDGGTLSQPKRGSSAYTIVNYVCSPETSSPSKPPQVQ